MNPPDMQNIRNPARDFWDCQAERFAARPLPGWEEDWILKLIDRFGIVGRGAEVLDIGCGAGRYCAAFSERAARVVGVDFSAEMIGRAEGLGIKNASFVRANWKKISPEKLRWEGAFDLAFSNMSAALGDWDDFEKAARTTRGWLVCAQPASRSDEVADILRGEVLGRPTPQFGAALKSAVKKLSEEGNPPEVFSRIHEREDLFTLEEASRFYLLKLSAEAELSEAESAKIRAALENFADRGKISSRVSTREVAAIWNKNGNPATRQ